MWQNIIVAIIAVVVVVIVGRKIWKNLRHPDHLCDGCSDCPLQDCCRNIKKKQ